MTFRTPAGTPAPDDPGGTTRRRGWLAPLLLLVLCAVVLLQLRAMQREQTAARLQYLGNAIAAETGRRLEATATLLKAARAWQLRRNDVRDEGESPYALLTSGCQRELGAGCRLMLADGRERMQSLLDGSAVVLPKRTPSLPPPGSLLIERSAGNDGASLLLVGVPGDGAASRGRELYAVVPAADFIRGYEALSAAGDAYVELLHVDGSPLLELGGQPRPDAATVSRTVALTPLPLRMRVSLAQPAWPDGWIASLTLLLLVGVLGWQLLPGLRRRPPTDVEPDTLLALRQAQRLGRGGHWAYDARRRSLKLSDELRGLLAHELSENLQRTGAGVDVPGHDTGSGATALLSDLRRAIVNECEFAGEYRARDGHGGVQWLSVRADASYDSDGRYLGHIAHVQDVTERKQLEMELRRLATTDSLTGVLNRRSFFDRAAEEIARARRYGRPLSLIALDLDHFKAINDRHGHLVGDQCLRAFTDTCTACLRRADQVGRLGGEEFAVLLPETGLPAAIGAAERIRTHVQRLGVPIGDGLPPVGFTVSAGITLLGDAHHSLEDLLAAANRALYRAKSAGRNRICVDGDGDGKAKTQADGV